LYVNNEAEKLAIPRRNGNPNPRIKEAENKVLTLK